MIDSHIYNELHVHTFENYFQRQQSHKFLAILTSFRLEYHFDLPDPTKSRREMMDLRNTWEV